MFKWFWIMFSLGAPVYWYNPLLRKIPPTNERFQASEFLGYSLLDIISNRSSLPKELFKLSPKIIIKKFRQNSLVRWINPREHVNSNLLKTRQIKTRSKCHLFILLINSTLKLYLHTFNSNKTNVKHILKKKLLQKHRRSFRFTCDVWICKSTAVYVIISRRSYQQCNQQNMHLNKFWISMAF